MLDKIRTEKQYKLVLVLIENLLQKATDCGSFSALSKAEAKELEKLSLLVEAYEDLKLNIMPLPVTIAAVVENKIKEMGITQAALAEMLGLGTSKLSQILNGKREPDVEFLKAVHSKLGISGDFLLEKA